MKNPLFTEQTECRDCYKCVRSCPVKAIRVKDHRADADSDRCIVCGNCVNTCPAGAQRIRKDLPRVQQLLQLKEKVYLSLAPSFPAEFPGSWKELLPKLHKAGFAGVSETAHGADLVSHHQARLLQAEKGLTISTACPTVVELVTRYYPELIPSLSPLTSPMQAHAAQLRTEFGDDIGVVFAGPCAAKKIEADSGHSNVDVAITFGELSALLDPISLSGIDKIPELIPSRPNRGVVYPIDGGMVETLRDEADGSLLQTGFVSLSGMDQIIQTLDELKEKPTDENLFCELLACEGGCINGSGSVCEDSLLTRRVRMTKFCREEEHLVPAGTGSFPELTLGEICRNDAVHAPVETTRYTDEEIADAFEQLYKRNEEDQLDCGGCGYNSCREFASAWLSDLAEMPMCVTSMRRRAQNKVNALIKTIPMGVVIVNRENRTLDCNDRFIRMFIGEEFCDEDAPERFRDMDLEKFIPVANLIQAVQEKLQPIEKIVKHNGRVLQTVLFPIEQSGATGILFQDITEPSMKRDTVIKKAEEVIHKNLQSVQQIASLLGENAAETEIILNSLIDAFDTGAEQ